MSQTAKSHLLLNHLHGRVIDHRHIQYGNAHTQEKAGGGEGVLRQSKPHGTLLNKKGSTISPCTALHYLAVHCHSHPPSHILMCFFKLMFVLCVYVLQPTHRGERTTYETEDGVLGLKLRLSDLVASSINHWANLWLSSPILSLLLLSVLEMGCRALCIPFPWPCSVN